MRVLSIWITAGIILCCLLSGCAREELMDLYGFTERFTYTALSVEDFYTEKDDNGADVYYTFFEKDSPAVMLKLICSQENKTDEIRIYLPKYDKNAEKKNLSAEEINVFIKVVVSATEAFTNCSKAEAEETARQMLLYDKSSYEKEGELTKSKNNFYYIYHSASLGCEFTVINTFLRQVPETEKPESRPMYGDTTKIRTETAPSK